MKISELSKLRWGNNILMSNAFMVFMTHTRGVAKYFLGGLSNVFKPLKN